MISIINIGTLCQIQCKNLKFLYNIFLIIYKQLTKVLFNKDYCETFFCFWVNKIKLFSEKFLTVGYEII